MIYDLWYWWVELERKGRTGENIENYRIMIYDIGGRNREKYTALKYIKWMIYRIMIYDLWFMIYDIDG